MKKEEVKIEVSSEKLQDIAYAISSAAKTAEHLGYKVSEIPLAEKEQGKKIEFQERNIQANILYVLAESLESLENKIEKIILDAGGTY